MAKNNQKELWLEVFKYNYKEGTIDTLATHVLEHLQKNYTITRNAADKSNKKSK